MKKLSALYTRYKETQRLLAEQALLRGKQRFVWFRGVLHFTILGLATAIIAMYRQKGPRPLFDWWNLKLLLGVLLVSVLFGYLFGHWQWNDYKRVVKR
jgi:hypothetical protein